MRTVEYLEYKSRQVRREILELSNSSGLNHFTPSLSCTDILSVIYYSGLFRLSQDDKYDKFILSKGHANIALYSILADLDFFPRGELQLLCKGSTLGGHPTHLIPGVEAISGSLGNGIGIAAGIALRAKLDKEDYTTIVLIGDGECYEGAVWEAARFIGQHKLNIIVVVDCNNLSATDFTYNSLSPELLSETFRTFGLKQVIVDGHNYYSLLNVFKKDERPLVIIAKTIKGKGVSFVEGNPLWHTKIPMNEELDLARKELCVTHL